MLERSLNISDIYHLFIWANTPWVTPSIFSSSGSASHLKILDSKIYSWKTTSKHFTAATFFFSSLAHGLPWYLQPCWHSLPFLLHSMLMCLQIPHSCPPNPCVPWFCPCYHSPTKQIFIEVPHYENHFDGPSVWNISLLSATPMMFLSPFCNTYTSFKTHSWQLILSIALFSFHHVKSLCLNESFYNCSTSPTRLGYSI